MPTGDNLAAKRCVPCEGKIAAMSNEEEDAHVNQVEGWTLLRDGVHRIRREFMFDDFAAAMTFVNKVAVIAGDEGHHPDIYIYYSKVVLELHTHAVGGLFENDFIIAAKVNQLAT